MKFIFLSLLWVLVLLGYLQLTASGFNSIVGGRQAGMGHAGVSLSDGWSLFNNQAGLGMLPHWETNLYVNPLFQVQGVSQKNLGIIVPQRYGTMGLGISHFGNNLYQETTLGLAFGKKLFDNFSSGIKLNFCQISIGENYGNAFLFTFEVGSLVRLSDNLRLGFHIFNPINTQFSSLQTEHIPATYRLGATYHISDKLLTICEIEKNILYKTKVKTGAEYMLIDDFYLRIGFASSPSLKESAQPGLGNNFTFGTGLLLNNFIIDFSANIHQVLGWNPQFSIRFSPYNKK